MKHLFMLVWGMVVVLGACAPADDAGINSGAIVAPEPAGEETTAARGEARGFIDVGRTVVNDVTFLGTSTFVGPIVLGTPVSFPTRAAPVAFTNRTLDWHVLGSTGSLVHPALQPGTVNFTTTGAITLDTVARLNPNCEYNRFDFSVKGAPGHLTFPAVMPQLTMVEVDGGGDTTAVLIAPSVLNTGFLSSYESGAVFAFTVTPFVPHPDRRYVVRLVNENGAGALPGYTFRGMKAFGSVVTFGRTGEFLQIPGASEGLNRAVCLDPQELEPRQRVRPVFVRKSHDVAPINVGRESGHAVGKLSPCLIARQGPGVHDVQRHQRSGDRAR